ncbi:protein of unknown function [Acetoanaerobium sticklandii]|uniref:Tyr recombinase domain-containing protein n=1 Tax=Acetoanaerobium sticklandii (strain ATCC 12662 / DSM 519 / JCM 1433 / CCUG 9281 / NCIMB 10654 / HF) TaxID=499177 RepID=E3PY54_ACESD|nr:site-specific integrase [Acetoanaerobium sticklandii]CBH21369.1 protein of unknown function [Acetoanaerobium sticklandii]
MRTIKTVVKEYKEFLQCEDLAESTKEKYSATIDELVDFIKVKYKKAKFISILKHDIIIDFSEHLFEKNEKTETIRVKLYAIKKFVMFVIDMQYINQKNISISRNFINHIISTRRTIKNKRGVIKDKDFNLILKAFENNNKKKLILLLKHEYGFRISEVLSIKWKDVNLEENKIYINNKKGNDAKVFKIDDKYMRQIDKLDRKSEWVFSSDKNQNGQIHRSTISKNFKNIRELNSIDENICLHSLRNTFTTNSVIKNTEDAYIQRHTGHKSLDVLNKYIVFEADNLRDVVDNSSLDFIIGN